MNFEYRTAAWVAVQILAEQAVSAPWDLSQTTFEWLRCETGEPVDDLMVGTSSNGIAFVQIKHSVRVTKDPNDSLGATVDQFVRQFHAHRVGLRGKRPWERPLDPAFDRLVLVAGPPTSSGISDDLPRVLTRLRTLSPGQSVHDSAQTQSEQAVFSVLNDHCRRAWGSVGSSEASDDSLRTMLSFVRIQILDLNEGGLAEQQAKDWLRASVLRDPSQADLAWSRLVTACGDFASKRSGSDRVGLHRILLESGIQLRAPASYREDIEILRRYSTRMVSDVSHLARIRVGDSEIKIARGSTGELQRAATEGSLVVVGDPGAGKSGALHDVAKSFAAEDADFVFLAVDHLVAQTASQLTADLGLKHDLDAVLRNWVGSTPGFLVIDALDAARAEQAATMLRDLIRSTMQHRNRWHVVASIRKFDLRYSPELAQLFVGTPPTSFRDPAEFARIRHVNIPRLSGDELGQIAVQCPELYSLIGSATPSLRQLLEVPFNLRLLAELFGEGVEADDLSPIRTQIELLDRYWAHRVLRDASRDAREAVLRRVCESMVAARALRVDRAVIVQGVDGVMLNELLSVQILAEWQPTATVAPERYILTFAHHVLFDYSVERLLMRGDPQKLIEWLIKEPELVVVVRPSLVLHFQELWERHPDRNPCWSLILDICKAEIPEIGKVIGPSVVVALARYQQDLARLCEAIASNVEASQKTGDQAFRHVVGAIMAASREELPVAGETAGPWCYLARHGSDCLRPSIAPAVAALVGVASEDPSNLTPAQRADLGEAARALLGYAWGVEPRQDWWVLRGITGVCRTFASDPSASALLLRRLLQGEHFQRYRSQELWWLAREVEHLIPHDSSLIEQLYTAAFTNDEDSDDTTAMGTSRILALTSTRRQDYRSALYALAGEFASFMRAHPIAATRAMLAALEYYIRHRHRSEGDAVIEATFDFNGRSARVMTDYSSIWDDRAYRDDDHLKLLGAFEAYVSEIADATDTDTLRSVVETVVERNRAAVVWRRLIKLGTQQFNSIGRQILPLASAPPILMAYDTSVLVGDYLGANFSLLSEIERERCERAILAIPDRDDGRREVGEQIRDRLLGCLPEDLLTTKEAVGCVRGLAGQGGPPPNEPLVKFSGWTSGTYGESEFLADQGVPIGDAPNVRMRELEEPVKAFSERHGNSPPSEGEIGSVLPHVVALREEIARAAVAGVHPKQQEYARARLAAACRCIAMSSHLSCDGPAGSVVREVLLESSASSDPVHRPESDSEFDKHPHWGSPSTRVEAADGLALLARHQSCASSEVLEAVERLSADPVPAVRYQIASRVNALYDTAPDLMWAIIRRFCEHDLSAGVLQGLVAGPLSRIAAHHPDEGVQFAKAVLGRLSDGEGVDRVRDSCLGIVSGLYVWRNHPACREPVERIVANPERHAEESRFILRNLRQALVVGSDESTTIEADAAIRARALDLVTRMLRAARTAVSALEQRVAVSSAGWSTESKEAARPLFGLIEDIGLEVYFASGAFAERQGHGAADEEAISEEQSSRFYREASGLVAELAQAATPGVAHHLLETLEAYIEDDPAGVFQRIGDVVRGGETGGYQYEALAADLVVRLVERYLAEYRALLRENEVCRRVLIEILDTFVRAGWPNAQRLAYRLDEIFR